MCSVISNGPNSSNLYFGLKNSWYNVPQGFQHIDINDNKPATFQNLLNVGGMLQILDR